MSGKTSGIGTVTYSQTPQQTQTRRRLAKQWRKTRKWCRQWLPNIHLLHLVLVKLVSLACHASLLQQHQPAGHFLIMTVIVLTDKKEWNWAHRLCCATQPRRSCICQGIFIIAAVEISSSAVIYPLSGESLHQWGPDRQVQTGSDETCSLWELEWLLHAQCYRFIFPMACIQLLLLARV